MRWSQWKAEQLQQELALREQNWRLQSVIDGTFAATWEWDIPSAQLMLNGHWSRHLGHVLDEQVPVSMRRWKEIVHPQDGRLRACCCSSILQGKRRFTRPCCGCATAMDIGYGG